MLDSLVHSGIITSYERNINNRKDDVIDYI